MHIMNGLTILIFSTFPWLIKFIYFKWEAIVEMVTLFIICTQKERKKCTRMIHQGKKLRAYRSYEQVLFVLWTNIILRISYLVIFKHCRQDFEMKTSLFFVLFLKQLPFSSASCDVVQTVHFFSRHSGKQQLSLTMIVNVSLITMDWGQKKRN